MLSVQWITYVTQLIIVLLQIYTQVFQQIFSFKLQIAVITFHNIRISLQPIKQIKSVLSHNLFIFFLLDTPYAQAISSYSSFLFSLKFDQYQPFIYLLYIDSEVDDINTNMKLIVKNRFSFGLTKFIHDTLYLNDPNHESYKIAGASIHTEPKIQSTIHVTQPFTYSSTKLPSGVRIVTQSVSIPSNVQLGIFVDVGTRDQDKQTSGAMLLLKHAFLKTAINTNETVNYGIAQMAGSHYDVKYNNESVFYRINCLSHDVIDVFSMLADCAFEPRNHVACSVGRSKNQQAHGLDAQNGGNLRFNDHIFAAAYGGKSLGNPLGGRRSNISNLSSEVIQKFQHANFTNDRIVISATGIQNHQQFVDLVGEKLGLTQLSGTKPNREPAQYVGGEIRNLVDSSNVHVALAFQGANYQNGYNLLVARQVLANESKSLLSKNVFVSEVHPFSSSFSDSGVFGLKLTGSASYGKDIVGVAAKALSGLSNLSEEQVKNAKASLKNRLARRFTNAAKRNEEITKAAYYLNEVGQDYAGKIDAVTTTSISSAVSQALKSNPTVAVEGGEVSSLPSYDKIRQLIN